MDQTKEPWTEEKTIDQPTTEAPVLHRSTRSQKSEEKKHKGKHKLPVGTLLCYMLVVTLLTTGVTLSKYTSTSTSSDAARVAKFDVQLDSTATTMNFNGSDYKDDAETQQYTFKVSGNSEVASAYSVKVVFKTSLPEQVQLRVDQAQPQEINGNRTEFVFKSDAYAFGTGPQEQTHTLDVQVNYMQNGQAYDFHTDSTILTLNPTITVVAEQKAPTM